MGAGSADEATRRWRRPSYAVDGSRPGRERGDGGDGGDGGGGGWRWVERQGGRAAGVIGRARCTGPQAGKVRWPAWPARVCSAHDLTLIARPRGGQNPASTPLDACTHHPPSSSTSHARTHIHAHTHSHSHAPHTHTRSLTHSLTHSLTRTHARLPQLRLDPFVLPVLLRLLLSLLLLLLHLLHLLHPLPSTRPSLLPLLLTRLHCTRSACTAAINPLPPALAPARPPCARSPFRQLSQIAAPPASPTLQAPGPSRPPSAYMLVAVAGQLQCQTHPSVHPNISSPYSY